MKNLQKIYYAAGPGNVVETFRHWINGVEDPSQFAQTYSSQFFGLIKKLDFEGLVVSTHDDRNELKNEILTVRNRPTIFSNPKSTIHYFVRQIAAALGIWKDVLIFRPKYAVIAEGTTFWSLLLPLRILGVKFIPSIHCVVRLPGKQSIFRRSLEWIEGHALRLLSTHCLSASNEISEQITVRKKHAFLPSYFRERFSSIPKAQYTHTPFNLLFIGRIEADKGIFELLEAFQNVSNDSTTNFTLDYCGMGSELEELSTVIEQQRIDRVVSVNGHCSFEKLQKKLSAAHVIVVPTTSRFVEGFNQVIVEGILSGRPVIATKVCPSAKLFPNGVTVIPADSVTALGEAIQTLSADENSYTEAVNSTGFDQERFFHSSESWQAQLMDCIQELSPAQHDKITHQTSTQTTQS